MNCRSKTNRLSDATIGSVVKYRSNAFKIWDKPTFNFGMILFNETSNYYLDIEGKYICQITILNEYGKVEILSIGYASRFNLNENGLFWSIP